MADEVKSDPKPTLEAALNDAHEKAAKKGWGDEWLKATIYVKGTNPIHDYIVVLQPGGP